MLGECIANTWQLHCKCMAREWQLLCKCVANAWPMHGKSMATARQLHGNCMATAWQLNGNCMANLAVAAVAWTNTAWQLHGKCMATAWQTHGNRVANAWQTHLLPRYHDDFVETLVEDLPGTSVAKKEFLCVLTPFSSYVACAKTFGTQSGGASSPAAADDENGEVGALDV